MKLKGKIFMCLTFLFIGVGIGLIGGYKFAKNNSNTGNQLQVTVDGKVKRGSEVNIQLDSEQSQDKKEEEEKWWKIF